MLNEQPSIEQLKKPNCFNYNNLTKYNTVPPTCKLGILLHKPNYDDRSAFFCSFHTAINNQDNTE